MSIVPSPEPLATATNDGLMPKEDKAKLNAYPDTPATPVVTSVTNGNGLTLTSGVLAMASSVANWTVTTLATLTETVTILVRATGAALALRSDLGNVAGDVAVKVGTSRTDGEANSSAELFRVATGLGGTEVSKFRVVKNGDIWSLTGKFGSYSSSNVYTWCDSGAARLVYVSTTFSVTSGVVQLHDGSKYVWKVDNGLVSQSGGDSSGTPGAATINNPIGKSAIAAGASSCVITNSLVAAGDWVMITQHARDTTCKELIAVCTANTITVSGSANATATLPFSWEVKKRI